MICFSLARFGIRLLLGIAELASACLPKFVFALLGLVCVWLGGFGLALVESALRWFDLGGVSSQACLEFGNNDIPSFNIRLWMGSRVNRGHRVTAILITSANLGYLILSLVWPDLASLGWVSICRLNPKGDAILIFICLLFDARLFRNRVAGRQRIALH